MKRYRLENKANDNSKLVDKQLKKTKRNLIVKLYKGFQQEILQIKEKNSGSYANFFSLKKFLIINHNLLLKLKEV